MKRLRLICRIFLTISILTFAAFPQTGGLPKFKKGEDYKNVRIKMIKAGWKPFHAKNSYKCDSGDTRCEGRPEMFNCSGTGLGFCEFLWKYGGKTLAIYTVGEEGGSYSKHAFVKPPDY